MGTITDGAKTAEHKAKEEGHAAARKGEMAKANDTSNTAGDRISAGTRGVIEGGKELKEGAQKQFHEHKAKN